MRARVRAQQRHDLRDERADLRAARRLLELLVVPGLLERAERAVEDLDGGACPGGRGRSARGSRGRRRCRTRRGGSRRRTSGRGRTQGRRRGRPRGWRAGAGRGGAAGAASSTRRTTISHRPMPIRSPSPTLAVRTAWPLTRVPLRLPVSRTSTVSPSQAITAWRRETLPSSRTRSSAGSRPTTRRPPSPSSTSRASSPSTTARWKPGLDAARRRSSNAGSAPGSVGDGGRGGPSAPGGGPVNSEVSVRSASRACTHTSASLRGGPVPTAAATRPPSPRTTVCAAAACGPNHWPTSAFVIGCASGSAAASGLTIRSSGGPAPSVRSGGAAAGIAGRPAGDGAASTRRMSIDAAVRRAGTASSRCSSMTVRSASCSTCGARVAAKDPGGASTARGGPRSAPTRRGLGLGTPTAMVGPRGPARRPGRSGTRARSAGRASGSAAGPRRRTSRTARGGGS